MAHAISITDGLIDPAVVREEIERGEDSGEKTRSEEKCIELSKNDKKQDAQMGLSEVSSKSPTLLLFILQ